jgi:amidophosphoribosyltransferase
MSDFLGEKCGIFGIFGNNMDVSRLTYYGLFALQHRGQESSGIATSNGWRIDVFKNKGLVTHAYSEENIQALKGHIAIGHNRYSTSEGTGLLHAQPALSRSGDLALAHNGNLPSVVKLQKFLQSKKILTENRTDSELMTDAIGYYLEQGETLPAAVKKSFPLFTGAFSVVAMTRDTLVAFRDHCGIRPLAMGKLNGGTIFASETCAFSTIGAEFIREVKPGEMVVVTEDEIKSIQLAPSNQKFDIFEFVYFARPDSVLFGRSVYEVRRRCGEILAKENPLKIDIVVPVPETAVPVAVGYAQASGVPFEMAIVKNRYVHRTFIEPDQRSRDLGVKMKLVPLPATLKGKRVGLIDDSIVRGTTSKQIVKALFDAGAREVHFMVSSPPVKFPDFYGIDTPKQEKLIAATHTRKQILDFLGANSLHYLSLAGLVKATTIPRNKLSLSCFTGEYPVDILERKKELGSV